MTLNRDRVCLTRRHCKACRKDARFRVSIGMPVLCPDGYTVWHLPRQFSEYGAGLGDRLATLIKWLTFGKVKPCAGCRKRQEKLNRLGLWLGRLCRRLNALTARRSVQHGG